MIMRFVMSARSGDIRETAVQKLNCVCVCAWVGKHALHFVCVLPCVLYYVCWINMCTGHSIIDKMGMPVCVIFTNIWSWGKGDGVYAPLCASKPGELCRVHDDSLSSLSLSLSLCQSFLSRSLFLVTVDRFNTIEHLTLPSCQGQSQPPLLSCLLSSPLFSPCLLPFSPL